MSLSMRECSSDLLAWERGRERGRGGHSDLVGVAYSDVILCDVTDMHQPPWVHVHLLHWLPRQQILDAATTKEFLQL